MQIPLISAKIFLLDIACQLDVPLMMTAQFVAALMFFTNADIACPANSFAVPPSSPSSVNESTGGASTGIAFFLAIYQY